MSTDDTQLAEQAPPTLVFDPTVYEHLLDDPALHADEREAVLKAIWDIIVLVLDFGLRVEFEKFYPQTAAKSADEGHIAIANMVSLEGAEKLSEKGTCREPDACQVKREFDESC